MEKEVAKFIDERIDGKLVLLKVMILLRLTMKYQNITM